VDKDILNLWTQVNGIKIQAPTVNTGSILSSPAPTVSFAVPNIAQPVPVAPVPVTLILTAPATSITTTLAGMSHVAKNLAPSKFSGNTEKVHFDSWINQWQLYLLAINATTDQDKVMMVLQNRICWTCRLLMTSLY
jgi:hypothetical protein